MHAYYEYTVGMTRKRKLQYTIRSVPEKVDHILREKAAQERKSLNEVTVDALSRGAGLTDEEIRYHDLDDLAGTWVEDAAFDEALRDMDRIDPELWK